MKEKIKKELRPLTEEEIEQLMKSLQGIFKEITIENVDRIPYAAKRLGELYRELGVL